MMLRAVRWRFMLNNQAPWHTVFHIQNIGYMLTQLLPLRLGDVARAVLIGNVPPITMAQGISTMVVERILDLLFFIVLLPFTLSEVETVPAWMQSYARGLGLATLGIIVVLIVAANSRPFTRRITTYIFNLIPFLNTENWVRRVDELLIGLGSLTRPRDGLILIFLSIAVWAPVIFADRRRCLRRSLQRCRTLLTGSGRRLPRHRHLCPGPDSQTTGGCFGQLCFFIPCHEYGLDDQPGVNRLVPHWVYVPTRRCLRPPLSTKNRHLTRSVINLRRVYKKGKRSALEVTVT
jgi:hypothetical protein